MPRVETLPQPENVADALTIAQALIAPSVEPGLQKTFGPDLSPAIDNARALAVQAIEQTMPSTSEKAIWKTAEEAARLRQERAGRAEVDDGPPSLPGDLADIVAEPPFFGELTPRAFTPKESEIVLVALRKAAAGRDPRAADLLERLGVRHVRRRPRLGRLVGATAFGLLRA